MLTNARHPCTGCRKPLEPDWRLCPYCGVRRSRLTTPASPATVWQLWNRYRYHVRDSMLPYLRSLAALGESESLEVRVDAWQPARCAEALTMAMRRLGELGQDTRLPIEFRLALTVYGRSRKHEANIGQALAPVSAEVQTAVQTLIDAGDIKAGLLQQVSGFIARREQTDEFVQIGTSMTGLDGGLLRVAGLVFASWLAASRANSRQQDWKQACLNLAAAADGLIARNWDDLVRRTESAGLRLREAQDLQQLEAKAAASWTNLVEHQQTTDGQFEQALTGVHALARQHPHVYPVQQLRKHADLLAEVRALLVGDWLSRVCIGISAESLARAQQHFLRLLPGDGVLAFFATTVFGQGKAGLALTTSSVQWLGDDQSAHRYGYAQLSHATITWTDSHLSIDGNQFDDLSEGDNAALGQALLACVRLSLADPGPAVCPCGAPGHWLYFGANEARCPGCGGAVNYA